MNREKTIGKFGGTSVANAEMIRKVAKIVENSPRMWQIIVSAPEGVTNLLFKCCASEGEIFEEHFQAAASRFVAIVEGLGIEFDLESYFERIRHLAQARLTDECVSRGEYICAQVVAKFLGFEFLDANQFIVMRDNGDLDMEATRRAWRALGLKDELRYVVPGFYGSLPDGSIKLFPRNSSDLSGSIVAVCSEATLFQKWTNVSGIRRAAPDLVPHAERIDELTYKELRELTDQGSRVLYSPAIFPLREANIPIEVKNTDKPNDPGTMVVPDNKAKQKPLGTIVGISARKDFTIFTVEKAMMGRGYAVRVLTVFDKLGIDIAHQTDGVDVMSLAVATVDIQNGKQAQIYSELRSTCKPDIIGNIQGMSIIAVVGHWMNGATGTAAKIFTALAEKGINLHIIDQSASQISIVIGVENKDCERAVAAIYESIYTKKKRKVRVVPKKETA